jgi:hypothetical protein
MRLRHAITTTAYYVQIFTEDVVFKNKSPLVKLLTAPADALQWTPLMKLPLLPLTGLTRKVLIRFELMPAPEIKIGR